MRASNREPLCNCFLGPSMTSAVNQGTMFNLRLYVRRAVVKNNCTQDPKKTPVDKDHPF